MILLVSSADNPVVTYKVNEFLMVLVIIGVLFL